MIAAGTSRRGKLLLATIVYKIRFAKSIAHRAKIGEGVVFCLSWAIAGAATRPACRNPGS